VDKFDRKLIVAIALIAFYLAIGTAFYHLAEGWRFVDAFYFTGTTLTTVGYGDLSPTNDFSKIVTVFFMFSGIGIVFYSVGVIAQKYFEREEERMQRIFETAREKSSFVAPALPLRNLAKRKRSEQLQTAEK
jgi:hypothetical protein